MRLLQIGGTDIKGAEVARGESFIEEKFEAASRDPELPDHVRQLIDSECAAIRTDHEEMKQIKSGAR